MMTEINLNHTSGINPAEQAGEVVDFSGTPLPLIAKKQAPDGRYSMSIYPDAGPDAGANDNSGTSSGTSPDTCVTAELPVHSGAGQIFDASGKPAGSGGK